MKAKVLIVDDEKDNLDALRRLLRKDFDVLSAETGAQALEIVKQNPDLEVLVSDQRMPGMTGSEFFQNVLSFAPKPTRILLTGFADLEAVIEAVNKGHIWRYVSKPWEPEDLIQTLHQAAERTRMSLSLERSKRDLEKALNELRAKDWARERLLLILLHEFRTAPQIIENLRALNDSDNSENTSLRLQFLDNLSRRFSLLESDIRLLLEDEKTFSSLSKSKVLLSKIIQDAIVPHKISINDTLSPQNISTWIDTNEEMLQKALHHLIGVLKSNSLDLSPEINLEEIPGPAGIYFLTLRLSSSEPILPKGLEKAALHPNLAWAALLEPFVGLEDFQHHSTGLRIETSRWVRFLNSQGFRPEFQILSPTNSPSSRKQHSVELIISFKKSI